MRKFVFLATLGSVLFCASVHADEASAAIAIPGWWSIPFLLLLSSIAFVPFIHKPFWEKFFAHISIGLGLLVAIIYATQLGDYGREKLFETSLDYFKFIVAQLIIIKGYSVFSNVEVSGVSSLLQISYCF